MPRRHGSYIGTVPEPDDSAAPGIWKVCDAQELLLDGKWPSQPAVPGAPTGTAGDGQVTLTWPALTTSPAVTDYGIEYSDDAGATWTTFTDSVSNSATATVTGLTNGTAYVFRLYGINALGDGPYGAASAAVTPSDNPVQSISGLVAHFRADLGVTADENDLVSEWQDQSGNANHATANAGEEPLYLASGIGGQPALGFNGSDQLISAAFDTPASLSALSAFVVYKRDGDGSGNDWMFMTADESLGFGLAPESNGTFRLLGFLNGSDFNGEHLTGNLNPHLAALTANGSATYAYLDGVKSTDAGSIAVSETVSILHIGGYPAGLPAPAAAGGEFLHGKIAEILLFNRVLTSGEIYAVEEYIAVKYGIECGNAALFHFDGADEGTTFTNSGTLSLSLSTEGSPQTSTSRSKFGSASLSLNDGVIHSANLTDVHDMASIDWTIEAWIWRPAAIGNATIVSLHNSDTAPFGLHFWVGDDDQLRWDEGSQECAIGGEVPTEQWTHVAAVRRQSTGAVTIYVDGISVDTSSVAPQAGPYKLSIGGVVGNAGEYGFTSQMYIDELRVLCGFAAYTANFTPPTAPF